MRCRAAQLLTIVLLTTTAGAEPTTAPAAQPALKIPVVPPPEQWAVLIEALDDRDRASREAAGEKLMLLSRENLPALRDLAKTIPMSPARRAALRNAVVHVYLTGKHRFHGTGNVRLGFEYFETALQGPVVVKQPAIGFDGYRMLHVDDVLVGVARFDPTGTATEIIRVNKLDELKEQFRQFSPGDWAVVRVVRVGSARDLAIRVGPADTQGKPSSSDDYAEGLRYWQANFAPALDAKPATRPADESL